MKKLIAGFTVLSFLLITASIQAGEFANVKKKIAEARDSAMVMLKNKDKRGADEQKKAKDTAEAVNMVMHKMQAPAGKEAKFNELHETWMAFKKTREEEVIPLILEGKESEAQKIADGIQKDRFKKMNELCDELDK